VLFITGKPTEGFAIMHETPGI